jgi:hypothetical protein
MIRKICNKIWKTLKACWTCQQLALVTLEIIRLPEDSPHHKIACVKAGKLSSQLDLISSKVRPDTLPPQSLS